MRYIYLDNNSTTPIDPRVLEEMLPYLKDKFGNPNNTHSKGLEARAAIEDAREKITKMLNIKEGDIYFTSGGTEGNNWILKGIAFANKNKGKHIITSCIEHKCVLETCKWLEKQGFEITYLKVDKEGFIDLDELENSLRKDTILVSIMLANNEIGTLEPIKEANKIVKEKSDAYFHTDACQAIGKIKVDIKKLDIDLLTLSGHKFYAPKGIGAIYIRENVKIDPLLHGGGQENNKRSGTENVPGIVGIGKAAEIVMKELEKDNEKLKKFQKKVINELMNRVENISLNGPSSLDKRLPGNINFSIENIIGRTLVTLLDQYNIAISSGSACSSNRLHPSHVLLSIGLSEEVANSSVRISIGRFNSEEDIEYLIETFPKAVEELRERDLSCF